MIRKSAPFAPLLLALSLAPAGAGVEKPVATLTWQSIGENAREIARDFERLYLTLYNTGNLATKQIENLKGVYVETLVREAGLFHGAYFPETIDSLLCDLNRDVCKRRLVPAPASALDSPTSHVGGYLPSAGIWTFSAGATLTVPDYNFESFTSLRKTPVDAGWTPDRFDPPESLDCSKWRMDCATLVRRFNRSLITLDKKGPQTAVLPVAGYTSEIPLRPDTSSKYSAVLEGLSERQGVIERRFAVPDTVEFHHGWTAQFKAESPTDLTIQALEPSLRSIGRARAYSVSEEPRFDQQVELFKLISHPFAADETLPSPFNRDVEILVLDSDYDREHCDLPDGPTAAAAADDCTEIVPSPHPLNDHGAHVVGLIAAPMNHRGIVGLNPNAKVKFEPIDRTFSTDGEVADIQLKLELAGTSEVRVANASWGFDRQISGGDLRNLMENLEDNLLVVAAAGNEGQNVTDDCRIFPACLHDFDNVITVVGINRDPEDPELWQGPTEASNSSPNFHIAAIADNVLSTVPNNRLGHLSGTSQAAPQVTAAASIIYSAAEHVFGELLEHGERLPPKIVKHRLIYTADLFPGLQTVVMSGRLNVRRAIGIFDSVIVLRDGNERRTLIGRITENPNDIVTCFNPAGEDDSHGWAAIRRLVHMPIRDRFVIFKHVRDRQDVVSRDAELVRVDGCNMNSLSHTGRIVLRETNQEVEFRLGDIVDYTSALFP